MTAFLLTMSLIIPFLQTISIPPVDSYLIADGSANRYQVTSGVEPEIEYTPVKPENSSTGIYSGGDYVKKTITKEHYQELERKVQLVLENKKNRIKDRVKGSFMIVVVKNGKEKVYLIEQGGEEIKAVESFLKQLIK